MKKLESKILKVVEKVVRPSANPGPMVPGCQFLYFQPKRPQK